MVRVRTNCKSLPHPIRIDELHGQQVLFGHGGGDRDPERVLADGFDGTPDVDDLVAAFKEALGVGGEVVLDALGASFVGLVDVDALHGAAEGLGGVCEALVGRLAADGVVEDGDLRGARAGPRMLVRSLVFSRTWSVEAASMLKANSKRER